MSSWGDSPQPGGGDEGDAATGARQGRRGRRALAVDADADDEPAERQQIASMDDEEDDGLNFIPDLEDEEADLGSKVAVAPTLKSSRVQTIMELDEALDAALPSSESIGGIDLSALQAYLTPQEQVQEEDVAWDVEHELQMIASELQKEKEELEGSAMPGHASPQSKKTKSVSEGGASSSLA